MGFTTGFTGGVTLTLGIAYLTVLSHERNRQTQAQALRAQSRVLQSLLEPAPLPPSQSRAELAREERTTLIQAAKDRWNDEVEGAVHRLQRTDWSEVREGVEAAVARLLGSGLQKSREGIEEAERQVGPKVQEAVDKSKAAARKVADQAARGLTHAEAKAGEYSDAAAAKGDNLVADAKAGAQDAGLSARHTWARGVDKSHELVEKAEKSSKESLNTGASTVDSARGTIRGAISKGIEKGKEAIGKAQAAVGIASETAESKAQSKVFGVSEVEKALHERYDKSDASDASVEEALAERYKPIDSRDNSVLRGV